MTGTVLSEADRLYFATPLAAGDGAAARAMLGDYVRALVEIALSYCAPLLEDLNPGILDRLPEITAEPVPWPALWSPALARLEACLVDSSGPSEIWAALAPVLVRLAAEGVISDGDIRLETPQAFYWGTVRLPLADRIVFRRTQDGIRVTPYRDGRRRKAANLNKGEDGLWRTDDVEALPVTWFDRIPIEMHCGDRAPGVIPAGGCVLADVPEKVDAAFAEAGNLLATHTPAFLTWVGDAVRTIVPLDTAGGARISATLEEFPGLVFLSLPVGALEIATRLVHESSHQFFFALKRMSRLHDGSDTRLYHSPIKNRGRSIELTLFAFHAFGNGALFHRDLIRADNRFEEIVGEALDVMMPRLTLLHGHLCETRALTPMGEMLWRPVADRLFDGVES